MLDRTVAPAFKKTISLSLPLAKNINNVSGIPVFYLTGLPQNIVKVEVILYAGKWHEKKIGVSNFTATMLEKGTVSRTSSQIAAELDLYGASLEISPGFDFVSVALYSLKNRIRELFPVFMEILTAPSFPEKEWQLTLDIFRQNLKVNNEKTSYVSSKIIRANIFGKDHPYGSSIEEKDAGLIGTNDLHDFFNKDFTTESVWILGDLTEGELRFIQDGLKVLRKGTPTAIATARDAVKAFPFETRKEGRTQSSIRLGKKGILRNDPEYADVLFATHVLGGFFGSRLMKNIREEKGLTYGISASLNAFRNDSLFVIGADVTQENVSLALDEIRKEIVNLSQVPMEKEELDLAKNHFIGSLQIDMANIFSVEEKLKNIHLNALGENFYQDLMIRIDAMLPERVMAAAEKYFDPSMLFEVVVG